MHNTCISCLFYYQILYGIKGDRIYGRMNYVLRRTRAKLIRDDGKTKQKSFPNEVL